MSPAPSNCSVESTEALLRDLVDVYSEPIITSPPRENEDLSPDRKTAATSWEETSTLSRDECLSPPEPSISQLVDECFPPTAEELPVQTSSQYPPFPPVFASYPTGGPPNMPEPPLLSTLSSRSKPLVQALHSECSPNILPLNLIQAAVSHETQVPTQLPLSTRATALQYDLLNLEKSHKAKADQLHLFYQLQAARLESDRTDHLCTSTQTPSLLPAVNEYFDMQHHALIDNIELQIHCLRYQFTPRNSKSTLTEETNRTEQHLYARKTSQRIKKTKPPPLNGVAIRIMSNWYERNIHHAYPSNETAEVMAKAGKITVEQVKKWFANKRMRNANTKPQRAAAAAKVKPLEQDFILEQQPFKKIKLEF